MKNTRVLFLPVLLVLVALISLTQPAAASPEVAAAGAPDAAEVSAEDFLCTLSQTSAPEVPGSTQAPNPVVEVCGTCGQDLCDNRNVGAVCYNTVYGYWAWCIPPWGGYCTDDRPNCQCAKEYQ